jgi:hypothetical protein
VVGEPYFNQKSHLFGVSEPYFNQKSRLLGVGEPYFNQKSIKENQKSAFENHKSVTVYPFMILIDTFHIDTSPFDVSFCSYSLQRDPHASRWECRTASPENGIIPRVTSIARSYFDSCS